MFAQHSFTSLPMRRKAYVVTMDEFVEIFGDQYTTRMFDIIPHPKGQSWYLLSTGETFTVVTQKEEVKAIVKEHAERAQTLKANREAKKEAK